MRFPTQHNPRATLESRPKYPVRRVFMLVQLRIVFLGNTVPATVRYFGYGVPQGLVAAPLVRTVIRSALSPGLSLLCLKVYEINKRVVTTAVGSYLTV